MKSQDHVLQSHHASSLAVERLHRCCEQANEE